MKPHTTRMTTKGQVVIPKDLRDGADMHVGDSLSLTSQDEDVRIAKRTGWARATAGCLASSQPSMEPEELDELMERAALRETREKWGDLD
jgi:AbrB family looped-hinge helix DNA binding protein